MARLKIEIKLTGKAKILQFLVRLEEGTNNEVDINLFTIDGGKTWTDSDILIETDKDLNVLLICKAFGKVDWEFYILDQDKQKKICEASGVTGDSGSLNASKREIIIPLNPLSSPIINVIS